MFGDWGDAKRGIFEDLIIYGVMFVVFLAFDPLVNLLRAAGFVIFNHEAVHPISYGTGQIIGLVFSGMQLLRKISAWKYYA